MGLYDKKDQRQHPRHGGRIVVVVPFAGEEEGGKIGVEALRDRARAASPLLLLLPVRLRGNDVGNISG